MHKTSHSVTEAFLVFLKLGCVAFGGPVAHLGYFQREFVQKRGWLSDAEYADLVALCQFLPGPASSQVGYALGLKRAGLSGAFAAWAAFTLPSAALMIGLAYGISTMGDLGQASWVIGLKLAAVAVVADAIWKMAAKLCPDLPRAAIALSAAGLLIFVQSALWQLLAIVMGMIAGRLFFPKGSEPESSVSDSPRVQRGWPWLAVFVVLLIGLPLSAYLFPGGWLALVAGFYQAGSLVFGGGHVVLPLLETTTVGSGWLNEDTFLAGYGAAQALPGPLFAFSAFLGAESAAGPGGVAGGLIALMAIYLPAWLLVLGTLPYWERLCKISEVKAALMGANAAVVGLLIAAFYDPIWTTAVTSLSHLGFALIAFGFLHYAKLPPWALVLLCAAGGGLLF